MVVSSDREAIPSSLEVEHKLKKRIKNNKLPFFNAIYSSNPEELAKLYDQNLELAKCLREKGINVPDPSQQEPKLDLSGLTKSKDEITPLLKECGYGESEYEK